MSIPTYKAVDISDVESCLANDLTDGELMDMLSVMLDLNKALFDNFIKWDRRDLELILTRKGSVELDQTTKKRKNERMREAMDIMKGHNIERENYREVIETALMLKDTEGAYGRSGICERLVRKGGACRICGDSIQTGILLRCGHYFHEKCLEGFMRTDGRKCPICGERVPLPPIADPRMADPSMADPRMADPRMADPPKADPPKVDTRPLLVADVFTGPGREGDFSWMVRQAQYQKDLFIFNDNEEAFRSGSLAAGGGNAIIRPYKGSVPPRAWGIPTGDRRGGYTALTDGVRATILEAVEQIRSLCEQHSYERLHFSATRDRRDLGTGIFTVAPGVRAFILEQLRQLTRPS